MDARNMTVEPGRYTVFYDDGCISMPMSGRHAKAVTLLYGGHYRALAPDWLDRLQDNLPHIARYCGQTVLPWLIVCIGSPILGYWLPSLLYSLFYQLGR